MACAHGACKCLCGDAMLEVQHFICSWKMLYIYNNLIIKHNVLIWHFLGSSIVMHILFLLCILCLFFHLLCAVFYVPRSLFRVPCSMSHVLFSMFCFPWSVFHVLCSTFHVPCSVFQVLCSVSCSMFCVPCSVFCVPCSMFHVLCPVFHGRCPVFTPTSLGVRLFPITRCSKWINNPLCPGGAVRGAEYLWASF